MFWYDLRELLPPVYRAIKTMYSIAGTENETLKGSLELGSLIKDNFYIQTCDESTLQYYEALLNITIHEGDSLDDRRKNILLTINNQQPYTLPFLKEQLNVIIGEGLWRVSITDGVNMTISVTDSFDSSISSMIFFVNRIKPAHVAFQVKSEMYSFESVIPLSYAQGACFVQSIANQ